LTLELHLSAWRVYLAFVWVGYMGWVAYFWLGFAGIGVVCVLSTRLLRRQLYRSTKVVRRIHLQADDIKGVWQLAGLLCIHTHSASHWILPGEILPGQRATLGAYLLEHVPRQAVGLRISS
jgi:hypothetical protein